MTAEVASAKMGFVPVQSTIKYDFIGQQKTTDREYIEMCRATDDYSISLASGNNLIGSATLVSIGDVHGLLTADHVWQRLVEGRVKDRLKEDEEHLDHFCMVLGPYLQRFEYPFAECSAIIVGKYSESHEAEGPDLTFIRLDPLKIETFEKLATLKSRKSFYPVIAEKLARFNLLPYKRSPWVVRGAPGEQVFKSVTTAGDEIIKISHFGGEASFQEMFEREGFDYVKVKIDSGKNNFPSRYGGVSGGGVWIPYWLSENEEGTRFKPAVMALLVGVVYLQIPDGRNSKILKMHGPKSIYENVISSVLQKGA